MSTIDHLFKFVLTGDATVGKSCLILRYAGDQFRKHYISTIGVEFKNCIREMAGKSVQLQIWDTAGQERFRAITSSHYRGAHGFLICFAVNNRASFDALERLVTELRERSNAQSCAVVLGLKCDVSDAEREVSYEEAEEYALRKGLTYMEVSAKTKFNVDEAFVTLIEELLDQREPGIIPGMVVSLSGPRACCVSCSSLDGSELARLDIDDDTTAAIIASQLSRELALPTRQLKFVLPSGAVLGKEQFRIPVAALLHRDAAQRALSVLHELDTDGTGALASAALLDVLRDTTEYQMWDEAQWSAATEQAAVAGTDAVDYRVVLKALFGVDAV